MCWRTNWCRHLSRLYRYDVLILSLLRLFETNIIETKNIDTVSSCSLFPTGCSDSYPRKMSSSCKRTYSCSKLKNKCNWTFRKVLSSKCEKKIAKADLNKKVKQYCLKSCRTKCPGMLIFSFNDKHQSHKLKNKRRK